MRKAIALTLLGFALVAFGCAGGQMQGEKAVTKQTKIKCPKCGADFTVGAGLSAIEARN